MRYRIDMSYDGRPFCGWQVQPGSPSVQQSLEEALGVLLRGRVGVTGAGRTDTGVSASAYTAHFDFEGELQPDCAQLRYKLNAILPTAISIQRITPVSDDFHARFSAVCREYAYYIHRIKDPFLGERSCFFAYPRLDFDAMNRAASQLVGKHDFSCFEKSGGDNKTSVCTVYGASWEQYKPEVSTWDGSGESPYWRFVISADRFLRNMVRAIVGTLLEVGRGKRSEENFSSLILPVTEGPKSLSSKRSQAGESVPGHALFLTAVDY